MRIWIFWSETNPICLLSHQLQYKGDVRDVERAEVHNEEQEQLRLPRPENQVRSAATVEQDGKNVRRYRLMCVLG